jgi:hypothetical protein
MWNINKTQFRLKYQTGWVRKAGERWEMLRKC